VICRSLFLVAALMACNGGPAVIVTNGGNANRQLTGIWDIRLSLERPYPLELTDPPAHRVCGTIGFVDSNQDVDGKVDGSAGVYQIDLTRIGLNWINDTRFPAAIAHHTDERFANQDSVAITLKPDGQERIQLAGVYGTTGIDGRWTARSSRGTASGVFTLRPHVPDVRPSTC